MGTSSETLVGTFSDIANAIRGKTNLQESIFPRDMATAISNIVATTPKVSLSPAASRTIDPYKVYEFGTLSMSMSISFNSSAVPSGRCAEYTFRFTAGSGAAIVLPSGCKFSGGQAPTFTNSRVYEYNIVDNLVVVGEFY